MKYFFSCGTPFSLTAVVLAAAMMIYFLIKSKRGKLLYSFLLFQLTCMFWSLPDIIHKVFVLCGVGTTVTFLTCIYINLLVICFTGSAWNLFCMYYTGTAATVGKLLRLAFWVFPAAVFLSALFDFTSNSFFYIKQDIHIYRKLLLIMFLTFYPSIVSSILILSRFYSKKCKSVKSQIKSLMAAITVPTLLITIQVIFYSGYIPYKDNNGYVPADYFLIAFLPMGFVISVFIISIAVFKYRFMHISPIAYKSMVEHTGESFVVFDNDGTIAEYNPSFAAAFFPLKQTITGIAISEFIELLNDLAIDSETTYILKQYITGSRKSYSNIELKLVRNGFICYSVGIYPIADKKGNLMGKLVSFNDVTSYKLLLKELVNKNLALQAANKKMDEVNALLRQYTSVAEELSASKERNRLAQDVHDTLGHTLTVLITLLNVCSIYQGKNPELVQAKLKEALLVSKDGMQKLRESVYGLNPGLLTENNLINSLKKLISEFELTGHHVDFFADSPEKNFDMELTNTVYRICREALTNSVRHGNANHAAIILRLENEYLKLFISDNGGGCTCIKPGMGLKGMEERIRGLGGYIEFGSDAGNGFSIGASIPLPQETGEKV